MGWGVGLIGLIPPEEHGIVDLEGEIAAYCFELVLACVDFVGGRTNIHIERICL